MKSADIAEMIQNNIAAFLLGYLVGGGLFPMMVEQISNAF